MTTKAGQISKIVTDAHGARPPPLLFPFFEKNKKREKREEDCVLSIKIESWVFPSFPVSHSLIRNGQHDGSDVVWEYIVGEWVWGRGGREEERTSRKKKGLVDLEAYGGPHKPAERIDGLALCSSA